MRHGFGSLATAALVAAYLVLPAGPAYANGTVGTFDHHPDVRVFTPTPLPPRAESHEPAVQPVKVVVHITLDALALDRRYRRALAWAWRKDHIHRVLGHRYTGFIRMYRGPRYPF